MKNILRAFTWLVTVGILMVSCDTTNELTPVSTVDENQSEIALIEKETGVTLFKQDLNLADESGKNKVVLRVAHKDKQMLENYLEAFSFSISPVLKKDVSRSSSAQAGGLSEGAEEKVTTNLDGIITEFMSTTLEPNVAGFSMRVKFNEKYSKNGRANAYGGYPNETTVTSGTWPELCRVDVYGRSIAYKFHGKTKWYSGWSSRYFCVDSNPSDCRWDWTQSAISTATINVDGPWKVRATVGYDANFQGDWSVTFINLD